MITPTEDRDVRNLVQMIAAVMNGDSIEAEVLLDATMTAFFTKAEQATLKHLYQHGPTAEPTGLDPNACVALEDELGLITAVVMRGGAGALALNAFGEPYGRLLAARK